MLFETNRILFLFDIFVKKYSEISFLQTEFPEFFPCIISFVSDESDNLGNTSFGESDGSVIGFFVQVPNYFSLQERGENLKIFDRKR